MTNVAHPITRLSPRIHNLNVVRRAPVSMARHLSSDSPMPAGALRVLGAEMKKKLTFEHERGMLGEGSKQAIIERDGRVCAYCGGEATTVDHVVPFSYSYDDSPRNLVACCLDCNIIASDKMFSSLALKQQYIVDKRAGRKWTKRFDKRKPSRCCDCHIIYYPLAHNATAFLCPVCAVAAKRLMPKERGEFIAKRRAELLERGIDFWLDEAPDTIQGTVAGV